MTTVTLTPDTLHRLHALTTFAQPANGRSPILQGVAVSVAGGEIRAHATDQYTVARWSGEAPEFEELAQILVPTALIVSAFKGSKNAYQVHLTHDPKADTLTFNWGDGSATGAPITGNIPPVGRLYSEPGLYTEIPEGLAFNPNLLARLTKLTRPARKPDERIVVFALSATPDARPNLYAEGDGYEVLICSIKPITR